MKLKIVDKQLTLVLIFCFFALLIYLKANDDPIMPILKNTPFEVAFQKWETGSSLIRDLCIGFLVSTIFWIFNIYIPKKKEIKEKEARLNKALFLILESFEGNPFHHDKHYIHCRELNIIDVDAIKVIKRNLDSRKIYGSLGEKAFFEICSESYELFKFLSIAANEISPMHGALWDSITRNITVIGRMQNIWFEERAKDGIKVGVDYSKGTLWLNLTEILESMEKWLELKK